MMLSSRAPRWPTRRGTRTRSGVASPPGCWEWDEEFLAPSVARRRDLLARRAAGEDAALPRDVLTTLLEHEDELGLTPRCCAARWRSPAGRRAHHRDRLRPLDRPRPGLGVGPPRGRRRGAHRPAVRAALHPRDAAAQPVEPGGSAPRAGAGPPPLRVEIPRARSVVLTCRGSTGTRRCSATTPTRSTRTARCPPGVAPVRTQLRRGHARLHRPGPRRGSCRGRARTRRAPVRAAHRLGAERAGRRGCGATPRTRRSATATPCARTGGATPCSCGLIPRRRPTGALPPRGHTRLQAVQQRGLRRSAT
jgi:hypothetical protein